MGARLGVSIGGSLIVVLCVVSSVAMAGMGSVTWSEVPTYFTLSDFTRARLEALSFFFLGVLICAVLVQVLWNYLRRDFVRLPRLSYFKAMTLVGLWGLLSIIVLTMISGARELMTPAAWEKKGLLYQLSKEEPPADTLSVQRYQSLQRLRAALWQYAEAHEGHFPANREDQALASMLWHVPDPSAMRYIYVPGRSADESAQPLAYEPAVFGHQRLMLLANGDIQEATIDQIRRRLEKEAL